MTRVVQREGIQPFKKISDAMLAWETNGAIVVFGFGQDQIGYVLFPGLHGLNVKKHVEGRSGDVVVVFLLHLVGLKPHGGPPFGARTSTPLAFAFLFLLTEFLGGGRFLNETTVGLPVHVLTAGRTVQVPAPMTLNGLVSHVLLETFMTATSTKANGGLRGGCRFSRMVFGAMGFVTSVSKKAAMAVLATSRGFETSRVSMKEIGELFWSTGPTMAFLFGASMTSCIVIGFPTGSTHVTGPKKSRQTGDDIVMAFLVEQDQLFVLDRTKDGDVEGTVRVHQQDLVADEGRRDTEGRQGVVAAGAWRDVGFVMKQQSQFFLEFGALSGGSTFWMLVQSGFGGDEGPGTTELIVILNSDDRFGSSC